VRVLYVCTGNVCRSPLAERFTLSELGSLAPGAVVESAGLEAQEGAAMDPLAEGELARLGGDPAGFRSRPFTPELAESADLVLTMTRTQRTEVLESVPRGLRKTFTLLEAADLVGYIDLGGLEHLRPALPTRVLALRLDAARRHHRDSPADDIADPIDQPARVHAEVADRIAAGVRPLATALLLHTGRASVSADERDGRLSA
jgi:protein-tyrosine phosphatase